MRSERADVLILGGGAAGTAAAITLRRRGDLSVVVIEKSDYRRPRIGETLSPGIQGLLKYLGVWDRFSTAVHRPAYGTAAAWGTNRLQARDFLLSPFGTGWHLDRRFFDRMLAQEATDSGASLRTRSRVVQIHRKQNDTWRAVIKRGGVETEINSRFVLDATGKSAGFATRHGSRLRVTDHLVGVTGVFRQSESFHSANFTFVEACENGWWYSAKLPDERILVSFMTDPDLARLHRYFRKNLWKNALSETTHTAGLVKEATPERSLKIHLAHSAFLDPPAGEGWLATGDAAACYDPLSSSGIPKALHTGIFAAQAVIRFLNEGSESGLVQYRDYVTQSFRMYEQTKARYYKMEQRWPHSPFWQRRHSEKENRG